jgi:hypothetical protein
MSVQTVQVAELTTEQKIDAIYEFIEGLKATLNNPMLQAMIPPGIFG